MSVREGSDFLENALKERGVLVLKDGKLQAQRENVAKLIESIKTSYNSLEQQRLQQLQDGLRH